MKLNQSIPTMLFNLDQKTITMELERSIRSVNNNKARTSSAMGKSTPDQHPNQGLATLLVMVAVLTIIILFCCFSAPGIRGLCRKYIFRSCRYDDPAVDNASTPVADSTTPTVILLPYGRMLVVDRTVFNQLQADQSGVDFLELGASLIRHQNAPFQTAGSTPSILDSDTTSKGISPTSLGYGPPAYEDIFGLKDLDLPPSYSEVSLMLKGLPRECIELEEIRVDRARTSDSLANNNDECRIEGQENQTENIENS